MKNLTVLLKYALCAILFLTMVPLGAVYLLGSPGTGIEGESNSPIDIINKVGIPKYVSVYLTEEKKTKRVKFEEYIKCVVSSEMPCTFEPEALKAQAVAARTYTLAKIEKYDIKKPESHPSAAICDTTHCQVYKDKKELIRIHEDGWEDVGYTKIAKAVDATKGEVMYHNGQLVMQPLFFSSSGGHTENSEDVFVGTYPYLVGVDSPYETEATHQDESKTFTLKSFSSKIKSECPNKDFGFITTESIRIKSRTNGGRVKTIAVGNTIIKGTDVRNALSLSSSLFDITFNGNLLTFTSSGSGHGVGMSQYGANGMAKKNYTYKQILKHYYTGVEIY